MTKSEFCSPCVNTTARPKLDLQVFKDRYIELQAALEQIMSSVPDPAMAYKFALQMVIRTLDDIKLLSGKGTFSRLDELEFSQDLLPKFMSLDFYYRELLWLECHKPVGSGAEMLAFYQGEIAFIRHFYSRHFSQYRNFKLRRMGISSADLPLDQCAVEVELEDDLPEDGYSRAAKFLGYELLMSKLVERAEGFEDTAKKMTGMPERLSKRYKWTGKVSNLVELAYGIFETGQLNEGQLLISDVLRCLGQAFDVDLQFGFAVYEDIKARKRISPVNFLEQMRVALLKRIDTENGYSASG